LRKFFQIYEVPDAVQVSEYLSRFKADTYIKLVNSILIQTKPLKRRGKLTFLVDATPVDLDLQYTAHKPVKKKTPHKKRIEMELRILLWLFMSDLKPP